MYTQLLLFGSLPLVSDPPSYWKRYKAYLKSSRWKRIREDTLEKANYLCQASKSPNCERLASQVCHKSHASWDRGGDIPGVSTIAICDNCRRWIYNHPVMLPDAANDNENLHYEDVVGEAS